MRYSTIDLEKYKSGFDTSVLEDEKNKKTDAEKAATDYANTGFQKSDNLNLYDYEANYAEQLAGQHRNYTYANQTALDEAIQNILNRKDFSYDFNADALYQQYKDKYIQQGKMAMADTMGQAAAMTGGYGSSYAQTAGQQQYQASLDNLNDIIPELYQMAYDRYVQEGQDLNNRYALLADDRNADYGMWSDELNRLLTDRDFYRTKADNEYAKEYGEWNDKYNRLLDDRTYYSTDYDKAYSREYGAWDDQRTYDQTQYWNETNLGYQQERDKVEDEQWQKSFDASTAGGSGGTGGGNGSGGGGTLWTATGTTDSNGNPIFRNSEGKTQAFGAGINPYTGTKHKDAKHGTFSNGYQPNNINGTKLKNSGMSTSITGKNQTIWEADGKYWLWRGDLNKYIEVDISDLDE